MKLKLKPVLLLTSSMLMLPLLFQNCTNPAVTTPWHEFLGVQYKDRSWSKAVRDPVGPSLGGFNAEDALISVYDPYLGATTKDFSDFFYKHLPVIIENNFNLDNTVVVPFGGLGSAKASEKDTEDIGYQRVESFLNLVKTDAGIYRNAMYERAKKFKCWGGVNANRSIYWQIGNEISSESYSKNIHRWRNDGATPTDSDISIIPAFVEYFLAPGVEGAQQGIDEVKDTCPYVNLYFMLGSIVNINTPAKQAYLEALLDYPIKGTFAPSLKGKKVSELLDAISIHYTIGGEMAWKTYLDNFIATRMGTGKRLRSIYSTEEIGIQGAAKGGAMASMAKILSRYLNFWEEKGWDATRGRVFLYATDQNYDVNGPQNGGGVVYNTNAGYFLDILYNLLPNEKLSKDQIGPIVSVSSGLVEWYSFRGVSGDMMASFFPDAASAEATVSKYIFKYYMSTQTPIVIINYLKKDQLVQRIVSATPRATYGEYAVDLSQYQLSNEEALVLVVKKAGTYALTP